MTSPAFAVPSDAEKEAVWKAYQARKPSRVPLRWNVNVRHIVLDPALNPEGWTFEQYVRDPDIHIRIRVRFQEFQRTAFSQVSDAPAQLPGQWVCGPDVQNTYDPLFFGSRLVFHEGQAPAAEPGFGLDDVDTFLQTDFSDVAANPFIRERFAFRAALEKAAAGFSHLGRPVAVNPFTLGFDGPVTAAAALFGTDFFILLGEDPEKASRVLGKITRDALVRNKALRRLAGLPEKPETAFFADDSIQLISLDAYTRWVLPWHRLYYEEMFTAPPGARYMHLCGDATRHFKTIRDHLGVIAFDTGFPVDHGALRRELGPDIEISGGPVVSLLQSGTPDACAAEARRILQSGVMAGGRFILQEGNNLAPRTPLANLAAVYETCLSVGRYT